MGDTRARNTCGECMGKGGFEWWLVLVPIAAVFLPLLLVWALGSLFGVGFF